jgi:hypothetical protein
MVGSRPPLSMRSLAQLGLVVSCLLAPSLSRAQAIDLGEIRSIDRSVANRVEAMVILGGDNGITGGTYSFNSGSNEDLRIIKGGGSGPVIRPRSLGWKGIEWAPLWIGNVGYLKADSTIRRTNLAGNDTTTKTYAAELGTGARFKLTKILSIAPKLSVIYGRTSSELNPYTQAGVDAKTFLGGKLVDWTLNSMSLVPAIDAKVDWDIGRASFEFKSDFRFFQVWSFGETSPLVSLDGHSETLINSIDVDVPLGWKILGRELHSGGAFSRAELFGDIEEALQTGHIQTVRGRLALDFAGKLWQTRWLGIDGSYFWAPNFSGWAVGLGVRMAF